MTDAEIQFLKTAANMFLTAKRVARTIPTWDAYARDILRVQMSVINSYCRLASPNAAIRDYVDNIAYHRRNTIGATLECRTKLDTIRMLGIDRRTILNHIGIATSP